MSGLAPWSVWVLAGVVLLVAEALAPGFFLLWLGVAAIGTGLLTLAFGLAAGAEVALFVVLAVASVAVGRVIARRPPTTVNAPEAGLVGCDVVAVAGVGATGRVRLGDSEWPARLAVGTSWAAGQTLRIQSVDGTTLVVAPPPT